MSPSLSPKIVNLKAFLKRLAEDEMNRTGVGDLCRDAGGLANRKQNAQQCIDTVCERGGTPDNQYSQPFKAEIGSCSPPSSSHLDCPGIQWQLIIVTEPNFLLSTKHRWDPRAPEGEHTDLCFFCFVSKRRLFYSEAKTWSINAAPSRRRHAFPRW